MPHQSLQQWSQRAPEPWGHSRVEDRYGTLVALVATCAQYVARVAEATCGILILAYGSSFDADKVTASYALPDDVSVSNAYSSKR